jgi:Spy/CpxP family protein refolding chaperone
MKKILTSMLALAIAFSSIAQTGKTLDKKGVKTEKKEFRHEAFDKLNLTDAQKTQIKSINEDFKQKMKDLQKNENITVKEQHEQRQALAKEHQEKLRAVLTADQQKQFAQQRQNGEKKDIFRKGFERGRASEIVKNLNLTAEQQAKVKELNQGLQTNVQSIKSNSALTDAQKKEQVKELMKKHREDIQSLLTQEQKQQLKSRLKNHPPNGKDAVK